MNQEIKFKKGDPVYFDLEFGNNYSTKGTISSGNMNAYGGHDVRRVSVFDKDGGRTIHTRRVCDIRKA
jgi:hypothetical protein